MVLADDRRQAREERKLRAEVERATNQMNLRQIADQAAKEKADKELEDKRKQQRRFIETETQKLNEVRQLNINEWNNMWKLIDDKREEDRRCKEAEKKMIEAQLARMSAARHVHWTQQAIDTLPRSKASVREMAKFRAERHPDNTLYEWEV